MTLAYIFPGQGAQYPGMGKNVAENYATARQTFEEADDLLGRYLSKVVFEGPQEDLTLTSNSQPSIFVTSIALWRVLQEQFPHLKPHFCAGLSLGEYSALVAAGKLTFADGLQLVEKRAQLMHDACEARAGAMAVVLGLEIAVVEGIAESLPEDLWVANLNCPGQVVLSGTLKGIELGSLQAKERGAKRVLPLEVHGAFHSGLMHSAETALTPFIQSAGFLESAVGIAMNATGALVTDIETVKEQLTRQVTHPVRWEQCIRTLLERGVDRWIEIGCGKTLNGLNRRIGVPSPTLNLETAEDFEQLAKEFAP